MGHTAGNYKKTGGKRQSHISYTMRCDGKRTREVLNLFDLAGGISFFSQLGLFSIDQQVAEQTNAYRYIRLKRKLVNIHRGEYT